MPTKAPDKASMNITCERELVEWVTETALVKGESRNRFVAECIALRRQIELAGWNMTRDKRLMLCPPCFPAHWTPEQCNDALEAMEDHEREQERVPG